MVLTVQQKTFIVESYFRNGTKIEGVWCYSFGACFEEFQNEFPEVVMDYHHFLTTADRCIKHFRENGTVLRKEGSGSTRVKRTAETIQAVRDVMENEPKTSIRRLSQQVDVSVGTCHTILHKDLDLYPYRVTAVQELLRDDYPRRLQFCEWFLRIFNNEDTLERIFFSDEAWFHRTGYVNSQNMRIWSNVNPHAHVEESLHPEKVGVWAAISKRRIIGPVFFEGNLNARRYRDEILQPFINLLDEEESQTHYYQQDGAAIHCTQETLAMLREVFDDRLISRNTANPWPPRSCDLTPCDFFLWPYLKNSVFATPVNNMEELRQRIEGKIYEINNNPNILQNVINGVRRRVILCQHEGGGHFQHIL